MTEPSERWQLHDLVVEGRWEGATLGERWRATFGSRPVTAATADLRVTLRLREGVPLAPPGEAQFRQGELLAYYLDEPDKVTAHFPRYGQVRLDLAAGRSEGELSQAALARHGVFEDLLAIALSPHLRRRGLFLLHAFAAQAPAGACALIVGDIGAGKTTTGLALLHAGWKLLSNDSPMLREAEAGGVEVLAYPGLLSAYPDTLERFPELRQFNTAPERREKVLFAAEAACPGVWAQAAPAGAIFFPRVEARAAHALEGLPPAEALRLILPHAIEQWDRALIAAHLRLLNRLVQAAPAYRLRLAADTSTLPGVISAGINHEDTRT